MHRPGNASSDILGIEVGRCAVRGVRLVQETTELVGAAECTFTVDAMPPDGVIDPMIVGPRLEELLDRLGVRDRSQVRVGFTIGPRNAGVGSGPAMSHWLESQAVNLQEPMTRAGDLGVVFLPTRALDAAVKVASGAGVDLVRVDFAPVAAARAIGDQIDDLICIGSGQGWQARMRDFEVLEAMENTGIGVDEPLTIYAPNGNGRPIDGYGWVEISPELADTSWLDLGQLAPAVGAAIGIAYESPANLLVGQTVGTPVESTTPSLDHLDGYQVGDGGAMTTLRLQRKRAEPDPPIRREVRQPVTTSLSPLTNGGTTVRARQPDSAWAARVDESDPITMFSPETAVEQIMGKRDRRLSVDILLGLLVLSAIVLVVAYLLQ